LTIKLIPKKENNKKQQFVEKQLLITL